ncbi:hypothetical protein N0V82_008794 [Gnomoniopsis sp. IMI 355080]|nr:hypothetical protein N0V82_008794 [Gnomoniopsis sp. IMI 355080]
MTALHTLEPSDLPDVENFASFQSLSSDGKMPHNPAPGSWIVPEFLLPPNTDVNEVLKQDAYGFGVTGIGFVNHTCIQNNVMTRRIMYGKRLVVAFIAKTDIHPGDQLYSNYGRPYFANMNSKCICNDWDGNGAPHLPPTSEELRRTGTVPVPAPERINTLAYMRQIQNVGPSNNGQPHSAFTESRTFEIDVSAGGNLVATREFTIPRSALTDAGGSKTIEIDLVLRRRGGGGGGVRKPVVAATARAPGHKSAGTQGPKARASSRQNKKKSGA